MCADTPWCSPAKGFASRFDWSGQPPQRLRVADWLDPVCDGAIDF